MAIPAFYSQMFTIEDIPGKIMIEFLLAILPEYQLKIFSLMLDMAHLALPESRVGMHAQSLLLTVSQICMASQAFIR